MKYWLETVSEILATDLGTSPRAARFLLCDFMWVAERAFAEGIGAEEFALMLSEDLPH